MGKTTGASLNIGAAEQCTYICTVVHQGTFFQVAFLINITVTTDTKKTFISADVFKCCFEAQ
jgi:hypothetical protein